MIPAVSGLIQPPRGQRMHRENEKSNLLVVCRLVLRAFLEDALGTGRRMVEGETQLIADLLVVLEKVLCHGFKGGKSLLSFRSTDAELWSSLKRMLSERSDLSETVTCVDQLEQLLTPISRIRCLLRLVMMQKKTMDLFHTIANSTYTKDAYEPWSLVRSEESEELIGSLLGLSVVDSSLIIEFDHLQEQPPSVDLSVYIKNGGDDCNGEGIDEGDEKRQKRMLLEQNSYLEERNRQLMSNLENMKVKIMEKEKMNKNGNGLSMRSLEERVVDREVMEEREKEVIDREERKKEQWERERKILHTQIAQKEDEITYHKQKVEDIQILNKDLYDKLRSKEEEGRRRERELVATNEHIAQEQFEGKCEQYSKTIAMLEKKQRELKESRDAIDELRRWRDRAIEELDELRPVKERYCRLESILDESNKRIEELERTLEEMGGRLSESQLQVLDLKEELLPSSQWEDDSSVTQCRICKHSYSLTNRKHHCRRCGLIFCKNCSSGRVRLASIPQPVRVCNECMNHLKSNINK